MFSETSNSSVNVKHSDVAFCSNILDFKGMNHTFFSFPGNILSTITLPQGRDTYLLQEGIIEELQLGFAELIDTETVFLLAFDNAV